MPFTDELRKLLFGNPFGEVYPPKANPPPLAVDGRTVALRILKKYIANLTFFRPMGVNHPPAPFVIPEKDIHIEWPDSIQDVVFPSVVILGSRANYASIGLTAYVEEGTRDKYQRGTVLQWQAEYTETLQVEIWASKRTERRSLLAGLETSLSPSEQMYGLRFTMPDYFNELVAFTLMRRELMEDVDSARNRRKAQLEIEMRFNVVALVNYAELTSILKTDVDVDEDTGVEVTLDDLLLDPNAEVLPP